MVNAAVTDARSAERALILDYAPADGRDALAALFALDDALGAILRTTQQPVVGQLRLAWWRDALIRLDDTPPPAQPVLQALARFVLPSGIKGSALATMVDGWEALLSEPLDEAALIEHARARAATLFAAGADVMRAVGDAYRQAGEGWALVDVSRNVSDAVAAQTAGALASERLREALSWRWSRRGRALGALAHAAAADLAKRPPGSPARVARLLAHRLTGF